MAARPPSWRACNHARSLHSARASSDRAGNERRGSPHLPRPQVSAAVRNELTKRASEFNILIDDVAITHLSFGTEVRCARCAPCCASCAALGQGIAAERSGSRERRPGGGPLPHWSSDHRRLPPAHCSQPRCMRASVLPRWPSRPSHLLLPWPPAATLRWPPAPPPAVHQGCGVKAGGAAGGGARAVRGHEGGPGAQGGGHPRRGGCMPGAGWENREAGRGGPFWCWAGPSGGVVRCCWQRGVLVQGRGRARRWPEQWVAVRAGRPGVALSGGGAPAQRHTPQPALYLNSPNSPPRPPSSHSSPAHRPSPAHQPSPPRRASRRRRASSRRPPRPRGRA